MPLPVANIQGISRKIEYRRFYQSWYRIDRMGAAHETIFSPLLDGLASANGHFRNYTDNTEHSS